MKILTSKAGKLPNATFVKNIGEKTFSYVGKEEEGFLIEELIFNGIKDHEIAKEKFQTIVETEDVFYFISFNDRDLNTNGENTLIYPKSEFSEEEVLDFISELVYDNNNLIAVKYENKKLHYFSPIHDIDFEKNESDIPVQKLISTKTKIMSVVKKYAIDAALVIMIIAIPLASIKPMKEKIIENREKAITVLKAKIAKSKAEEAKLKGKIDKEVAKYNKYKNAKDILKNKRFDYIWKS